MVGPGEVVEAGARVRMASQDLEVSRVRRWSGGAGEEGAGG
jgi:hypothetical protein